jgi:hypothetical protein
MSPKSMLASLKDMQPRLLMPAIWQNPGFSLNEHYRSRQFHTLQANHPIDTEVHLHISCELSPDPIAPYTNPPSLLPLLHHTMMHVYHGTGCTFSHADKISCTKTMQRLDVELHIPSRPVLCLLLTASATFSFELLNKVSSTTQEGPNHIGKLT